MAVTLDGVFVKIVKWDSSTDWVLKNVSLSVGKGTIYALCGPSGSGKTTVCLTILGLTKVSHGRVDLSPLDQKSVQIPGKDVGMYP
jgi:ABC-type multidrug transport system ATPase subunit